MITKEAKIQLLKNEITMYENSLYVLEVRHRVAKKTGGDKEVLSNIEKEMTNAEFGLDELKVVLKELDSA